MKFKILDHADHKTIENMYNEYTPVFILSTGRSGSKFIASLLNQSSEIMAYHEASPALEYFSNFAYHNQSQKALLIKMIDAARMELILDAYSKEKIFVESNQCLTFFAPAIRELFKKSKFVHIVRHPADFVRSALRKGWYINDSIWEIGRVRMNDEQGWETLDQVEKLSWLWQTTNQFIENFKCQIDSDRIMTFRIEDIFENVAQVQKMVQFVGTRSIPESDIRRIQGVRINELRITPNEPVNIKKTLHFPVYPIWDEPAKESLKRYCAALSATYGYMTLFKKKCDSKHPFLLSVIIPNHNNGQYLKQCLDSILAQTYQNIEIVVSDDCSTDNSRTIIREYEKLYPDKIRGLYLEKNFGVAFNRNYAIRRAKGEYITTLDSDDYYDNPQKLEKEMELIIFYKHEKQQDIIAFSDIALVTEENQRIRYQSVHENIREGMIFEEILTRSCMIPRDFVALRTAYSENGGYDPQFTTHEDWDLKIRLAAKYEFHYTGITGTAYRQHGKGLSLLPFQERTKNLWHVFNNNIDTIGENEQKQKLISAFSIFMTKRQQEYFEYLKYRFHQQSREERGGQGRLFCVKMLVYDFGLYGLVIAQNLLAKKIWTKLKIFFMR